MARTIGWLLLAAILALGGAGLVGQLSHPPGDARREELTWAADHALTSSLDDAAARLATVGSLVDGLADDAKAALVAVSSGDGDALKTALDRGAARAATIDATVAQLRASLAGLPGDDPGAATLYANDTLVRRRALVQAVDAVGTLSDGWTRVSARSSEVSALTVAIRGHDTTLATAASAGVKAKYATAIKGCNDALTTLDAISAMRRDFVQGTDVTVLDDWIARHLRYDKALLALYTALKASGGARNPTVDAAYREQTLALAQLPPDNRQIVLILAEVAQGGLNQAVLAIEDARGQIDGAIAGATPS